MTRSRTIVARGIPAAAWVAILVPVCAVACAVDDRELGLAGEGASDEGSGTAPDVALPALAAGRVLATARRSFDFGVIPPGQTATGVIVAGNIGDQTVTDVAASIDGPFASEFTAVPSAPCSELRSRASCSVNLTFTPQAAGAREARLVLSAPDTPPLELQLRGGTPIVDEEPAGSGTPFGNGAGTPGGGVPSSSMPGTEVIGVPGGANGSLQLSYSDLRFPDLGVQQASEVVEVTVQNTATTSTGQLQVVSDAALDFLVDTTCGTALAPGAACTVSVQFRPSTGGERSGTLVVSDGVQQATLLVSGAGMYRLTVARAGEGVGAVSGLGIDCGATCSGLFAPGSVSLRAATSNGSDSFFTGWSGSPGCTGPLRDCVLNLDQSLTLTATFARQTNNLIFVTSQSYPSDFGAGGFDAECNRLASAAGINNAAGNAYVAAVSGAESFWSRVPANARGWLRMDGLPFGDQRAQMLIDPPNVYHPARFDETGRTPPLFPIWTGTGANGDRATNCSNWTSATADQTGQAGHLHDLRGWGAWNAYPCDNFADVGGLPILCMGTTKTAPLVLPSFAGKRIWLTNTIYQVGSTTPDQKCQAERPAGVSSARALVAVAGRSAAAVLDPAAVYVRPDGQLVGTGAQIVSNEKPGVPWIAANGSRVYDYVWTGQPETIENRLPTAADTCSDWTSSSGTGVEGQSGYDNMIGFDIFLRPVPCTSPGRLYCVEP